MGALPPVNSVMKHIVKQLITPENVFNILYQQFSGGVPSETLVNTIAEATRAAWHDHMLAVQTNDLALEGVESIDLTSDTSATGFSSGAPANGGISTAATPNNCCIVISKEISRRYRGGHPRLYLGGVATAEINSGTTWSPTYINAVATAWGAFNTAITGVTYSGITMGPLVNVSYYTGGAVRATPIVDPIQEFVVKPRVCSQRRRLGKAGS